MVAGVAKTEIRQRVERAASMLGLADRLKDRPSQLSGGQRQRVALGRAIVREPDLFLLDEPLSNLDADLRERMRAEIVRIQKKVNTTTIHVTHDQAEALTMADRIALLNEGKLVQIGSPQELYANPADLFTARFIGQPKINIIERAATDGAMDPFRPSRIVAGSELPTVGLRPEAFRIEDDGSYQAVVKECEYFGDQYILKITYDEIDLTVSKISQPIAPGTSVRFSFNQSDLLFFDSASGKRLV